MALMIGPASAQNTAPSSDNTKVNKRDRDAAQATADQGKNNNLDRETMRKIRRAVMNDKSLSTYAHNIKIISQHGKVTLKGPVHTEDEKRSIEAKATEIAGDGNVTNQITVKGDSK
jgi:hyperosmotically inducible periplasmic protein